jgi:pyruvate/2-oxoacid:ferredoxin oxidoreductase beta subunit
MAENPAVFGAHLKSERQVVCFAGEKTTDRFINSVIKSNVLYICYNTSGKVRFAKAFGLHKYAATASVAYPEDFKAKIEKAKNNGGFIELLCPCPKEWEFDPSNTVVVARSGVESGIWQLYEIENKKFNFTYKPAKLEPLDIFLNLQKKFRAEQGTINRNWKLTVEDRNWEIE